MATPVIDLPFRFDADEHVYTELATGAHLPHITGMLDRCGWVDEEWFTEASCERGTAVHHMTADYDLGALDVPSCVSPYRGYLLSHVKAMEIIRPTIEEVEEPHVHPTFRYGGRPDRVVRAYNLRAVLEGKSGGPARSHQIQTALQAILVAPSLNLPAEALGRFLLYWKDNGKFTLEEHRDRRDFDEAYRIIRKCCA